MLTHCFLPFLYRSECTAVDPKVLTVPICVVRELALISLVPRDAATLAMVIIACRVCTLFCPGPLGPVRVIPLDLSTRTRSFPALYHFRMSLSQTHRNTFRDGFSLYPGSCANSFGVPLRKPYSNPATCAGC